MDHCKAPSNWTFAPDRSGARLEDIDHDRHRRTGHEHRDHAGTARGGRVRHRGLRRRRRRPAGAHHVHRLHRPGRPARRRCCWSGSPRPVRRRLAHAGVGTARRTRQRGRSIFLLRGLSRGRMAVVAPDVRGRRGRPAGPGGTRQRRATGHPGLDRPRPRVAGDLAGLAPGRGRHRSPRPPSRGAFVDGLLGGLGFGVLFVALGQIPESAGTLPLALNQLTGALVTVAVATVLRQDWQPSRGAAGWGLALGPARGVGQPRLRRGQPPRRPRRGRGARLALPRRHGAPGPRPAQRAPRRRAAPRAGLLLRGRRA